MSARSLVKQGYKSKEQILNHARDQFGELSPLLKKQIDEIFEAPKSKKSIPTETSGKFVLSREYYLNEMKNA